LDASGFRKLNRLKFMLMVCIISFPAIIIAFGIWQAFDLGIIAKTIFNMSLMLLILFPGILTGVYAKRLNLVADQLFLKSPIAALLHKVKISKL
jgi:hypothetical protein